MAVLLFATSNIHLTWVAVVRLHAESASDPLEMVGC